MNFNDFNPVAVSFQLLFQRGIFITDGHVLNNVASAIDSEGGWAEPSCDAFASLAARILFGMNKKSEIKSGHKLLTSQNN